MALCMNIDIDAVCKLTLSNKWHPVITLAASVGVAVPVLSFHHRVSQGVAGLLEQASSQ